MCHSRSYHSSGIVPYFQSQIRFGSIFPFFVFFNFCKPDNFEKRSPFCLFLSLSKRQQLLVKEVMGCFFFKGSTGKQHHNTYLVWGVKTAMNAIYLCLFLRERNLFYSRFLMGSKSIGTCRFSHFRSLVLSTPVVF